jgi:hypothetical protein
MPTASLDEWPGPWEEYKPVNCYDRRKERRAFVKRLFQGHYREVPVNKFAKYLDTLPTKRQVEIVHQLIQTGTVRSCRLGDTSLDGAISRLRSEEFETLSILIGSGRMRPDEVTSKVMEFILIHPLAPTSKLPPLYA